MGAGRYIGAAARKANHGEALDAQPVRHRRQVAWPIEQGPAREKVRPATAGSIDDDEASAQGPGGLIVWPIEPRAGRAMTEEHRPSRGVAVLRERDPAILESNVGLQDTGSIADCWRRGKRPAGRGRAGGGRAARHAGGARPAKSADQMRDTRNHVLELCLARRSSMGRIGPWARGGRSGLAGTALAVGTDTGPTVIRGPPGSRKGDDDQNISTKHRVADGDRCVWSPRCWRILVSLWLPFRPIPA